MIRHDIDNAVEGLYPEERPDLTGRDASAPTIDDKPGDANDKGPSVRYKRITRSIVTAMLWACTCIASAAGAGAADRDEPAGNRLTPGPIMESSAAFSAKIESSPAIDQIDRARLPSAVTRYTIIAQANILFGEQQPTTITIDIIPASPDNIVRPGAWRLLPVAILGSAELEVTSINPRTIRLNGVDIMLVGKSDKSLCVEKDINDDTYMDLLCDVRSTGFKIDEGDYAIIIKAGTYSGESLRGEDRIKIVGK